MRSTGLFALAILLLAACKSDDSGNDDAVAIDAADEPPDAPADPPDAGCEGEVCDGVCYDTSSDEEHCGDCETVCEQTGSVCEDACICPMDFVPDEPTFLAQGIEELAPGIFFSYGGFPSAGKINALVVVAATALELDTPYDLTGELEPPAIGVGYDVDIESQEAAAAFFATAGTITFTQICAEGIAGHADGLTFQAVESLENPEVDEEGCSFEVEVVNFAFGEDCPEE
jgi:hypothetical protein